MARPGIFLNAVGDVGPLPPVLLAADELGPAPADKAMAGLSERAGPTPIFGPRPFREWSAFKRQQAPER